MRRCLANFTVSTNHGVKIKENGKRDKYLHLTREIKKKKSMQHEGDSNTSCNWRTWNGPQRLGKKTGRVGNRKTNRGHPNYSIKIDQNTEKSPGDLRRLAVTQTPIKGH